MQLRMVARVYDLLRIYLKLLSINFVGVFRSKILYGLILWGLSIVELYIRVRFRFVIPPIFFGDNYVRFGWLLNLMCASWSIMGSVVFGIIVGWTLAPWPPTILQRILGCQFLFIGGVQYGIRVSSKKCYPIWSLHKIYWFLSLVKNLI